ncbi:MAG: diguanylate cyclase domain-containing protein, partial [Janthinobacterium lividum]
SALRPGDFAGRYGQEEFALILTDTERGGASVVATRILVAIETLGKDYFNDIDDFKSTVTIGFATTHPSHKDLKTSSAALSVAVDIAVYEAKLSGINQIVIQNNYTTLKEVTPSTISHNLQTHNDILA